MKLTPEEEAACDTVERLMRAIGQDCQAIVGLRTVEVAPLSWTGSCVCPTLKEAIAEAFDSE